MWTSESVDFHHERRSKRFSTTSPSLSFGQLPCIISRHIRHIGDPQRCAIQHVFTLRICHSSTMATPLGPILKHSDNFWSDHAASEHHHPKWNKSSFVDEEARLLAKCWMDQRTDLLHVLV
ncbi:unnamed protein product [Phytophthora lilii]|uniref:Unnamed protein product n=1 Tax=Phytophthora lilii TaxID=2077276 RepID=A0A9W6YJC6_9STRA|nr:unnamed protein product [Phytophthora lilii]